MASSAWIGSREFNPGNIVPGLEDTVVSGSGSISGGGSLTSAGNKTGPGIAILSGGGSLESSGLKIAIGSAQLLGGGTLVAIGEPDGFPFTSLIGHPASNPGNIVPGLGGTSIAIVVPPMLGGALYRIQLFAFDEDFGIGALVADFDRIHALGYADYLNNVPEAFFSLHQDDPKIQRLRGRHGRVHVRIRREGQIVWTGWASLERDANPSDAIIYCYGYLAGTYWSHTAWKQEWENATIGNIVGDVWDRARSLTNSRLSFIGTGVVQTPPTTAGGSTPITLPIYETYYKRILFVLQEMAAISASDTGNSTSFEITHSETPSFNFWTDRSNDLNRTAWAWGDGRVQGFREYSMPLWHRNAILAVGQNPRAIVLQHSEIDTTDQTTGGWGRMEESLFFPWVRDEDELKRVVKLRAAKAKREDMNLVLTFFPGAEVPPGLIQSRWELGDTAIVRIDRGLTEVNGRRQIVGYMTVATGNREQTRVILQEPL